MDQNRVRELIAQLPPESAYPPGPRRSPFQPARQQPAERFALALRDPAFGASFVGAFIEKRRWLPTSVREWPLLQLFLTRAFKVTEPLMLEVESFRTETRRQERDILDALLLTEDTSLAGIAEILNTREEVIEAYEVLFWNVRDRRHEKAYLNSLLNPAGWQAAIRDAKPNAEGDRLRLLQAGAMEGADAVLELAGFNAKMNMDASVDPQGQLERHVQADAERRMRAGCRMEDGVVKSAYTAASRLQESGKAEDLLALHNINAVSPALDEIRKHNGIKCEPMPDYRVTLEKARAEVEAMLNITRRGQVKSEDA